MSPFEAFLAFLTVAGVLSIPLAAIITRRNSPIGQALADRIRRRTELRFPASQSSGAVSQPGVDEGRLLPSHAVSHRLDLQQELIEQQQQAMDELSAKLDFVQRLLETPKTER